MSPPEERAAEPNDDLFPNPLKPKPNPPYSPWLYAGVLLIVIVGGIGFGIAVQSLTVACGPSPSGTAFYGVPSCGSLFVAAVAGAIVGGVALALGVLLLRQAKVTPSRRVPLAAGIFVALLIIVAGLPPLTVPPPANIGIPPSLPFPIPAGTTFTVSLDAFGSYAEAQIPRDPYAWYAPIEIQGAYNATSTVCMDVNLANGGPGIGGNGGGGLVCGTSASFVFFISSATWTIVFSLPQAFPQTVFSATVVVTSPIQVVY